MVAFFCRKDPDIDLTAGIIELIIGVILAPVAFSMLAGPSGIVLGVFGLCLIIAGAIDSLNGARALAATYNDTTSPQVE